MTTAVWMACVLIGVLAVTGGAVAGLLAVVARAIERRRE